jgi:hypothetical protein
MSLLILPKAEPGWVREEENDNTESLDDRIRSGRLPGKA